MTPARSHAVAAHLLMRAARTLEERYRASGVPELADALAEYGVELAGRVRRYAELAKVERRARGGQ